MEVGGLGFVLDPVTAHLEIGIIPGLDILGIHESVGSKNEILLGSKESTVRLMQRSKQ